MNVSEAIRSRYSTKIFKDTAPLSKQTIEELLEGATWAPNHYHTEPWKFFVITGDGREKLSGAMKKWMTGRVDDPDSDEGTRRIEKIGRKPFTAPTIIVVAMSPDLDNKKAIYIEDVCATSAAIQNILLEAHSKGIGAIWKSGSVYNGEPVKNLFKLRDDEEVIGTIFLGEPDMKKEIKRERKSAEDKTVWIDKGASEA